MRIVLNKAISLFLVCVMLLSMSPLTYAVDNASNDSDDIPSDLSVNEQTPDTHPEDLNIEDRISTEDTINQEISEDPQAEYAAGILAEDCEDKILEGSLPDDNMENPAGGELAATYESACINIYVVCADESQNAGLQITNANAFNGNSNQAEFNEDNTISLSYDEALDLLQFHFYDPDSEESDGRDWNKSIYGLLPEEFLNQFGLFHGRTDFGFELFEAKNDSFLKQFALMLIKRNDDPIIYYSVIQFAQQLNAEDLNRLLIEYNVENSEFAGLNVEETESIIVLRDDIRCSMESSVSGPFVPAEVQMINVVLTAQPADISEESPQEPALDEQVLVEDMSRETNETAIAVQQAENTTDEITDDALTNELDVTPTELIPWQNSDAHNNSEAISTDNDETLEYRTTPLSEEALLLNPEIQGAGSAVPDSLMVEEAVDSTFAFLIDSIASTSEKVNGNADDAIGEDVQEHITEVQTGIEENAENAGNHVIDKDDGFVDLSYGTTVIEESTGNVPSYTVDFYYSKEVINQETGEIEIVQTEHHIQGGTSILLSDLFEILGIDKSVSEVADVNFTDSNLVAIERLDGDYRIVSLAPFQTEEVMSIVLNDNTTIDINVEDAIATGTSGTCTWTISDAGVLTISPTSGSSGELYNWADTSAPPWYNYASLITSARFTGTVYARQCSSFFSNCTNLTSVNFSGFNTSLTSSMRQMFFNCSSLTSVDMSSLRTPGIHDMAWMFSGCTNITTINMANFDTTYVNYMNEMFQDCHKLTTLNISSFNTNNVQTMSGMFDGCESLPSLDLSHFRTLGLTNMYRMFADCSSLTSLNVSSFNTASVTDMRDTFCNCKLLTSLNVSNFNTSSVTSMLGMFLHCESLQSLDCSSFNTSSVSNMHSMFAGCKNLVSLNVSNFNTSSVSTMTSMFSGCEKLTQLNVSSFNTSNVTDMSYMFNECRALTSLDISRFNTSSVNNMSRMFRYCATLSAINVSNFNTSNVTDMCLMFGGCYNLSSIDLSNFNTARVTDMSSMFRQCNRLTVLNINNFNTSAATDMSYMFDGCVGLSTIVLGRNFRFKASANTTTPKAVLPDNGNWNKSDGSVGPLTTEQVREQYDSNSSTWYGTWILDTWWRIVDGELIIGNGGTLTIPVDPEYIIGEEVPIWPWYEQSSEITSVLFNGNVISSSTCAGMFYDCANLVSVDFSGFNTANAVDFGNLFVNCSSLSNINWSSLNTSNVVSFAYMFYGCSGIAELNLSGFDTSSATNMSGMFYDCGSLRQLNLSSFNTSTAADMSYMFTNCSALREINLGVSFKFKGTANTTTPKAILPAPSGTGFTGKWIKYDESVTSLTPANLRDQWDSKVSTWAGWWIAEKSTYTITYDANGGTGAPASMTRSAKATVYLSTEVPTRSGYDFLGWSIDKNAIVAEYAPGASFSRAGDTILYAVWGEAGAPITIVYNAGNGSFPNNESINTVGYLATRGREMTKVSHTSNFSDDGVRSGNLTEDFIATSDVVSIPGADSLTVEITYATYSSTAALHVFQGEYHGHVELNLSAGQLYTLSGGNSTATSVSYTIPGDTVTFSYASSGSSSSYGYFAVITGVGVEQEIISGSYEEPTSNNPDYCFKGWSRTPDGSSGIISHNALTMSETLYAIYDYLDSGTWWHITGDGELVIGNGGTLTIPIDAYSESDWPWSDNRPQITSVSIDGTVNSRSKCTYMFSHLYNATSISLSGFNTSSATNMSYMFQNCRLVETLNLTSFSTNSVTNMSYMFQDCKLVETLDLTSFSTNSVTNMGGMFKGCVNLRSINISSFRTPVLTRTASMFESCSSLENINLSNFDTSHVTSMVSMFSNCKQLSSLNLSNFQTNLVTSFSSMFSNCILLTSLDISNFNTSAASNMSSMFNRCPSLQSVAIGANFRFAGNNISSVSSRSIFPNHSRWKRSDNSVGPFLATELRDQYDANAASWAGTWVAETWWRIEDDELIIGTGGDFTVPVSGTSATSWPWYDFKSSVTSLSFDGIVRINGDCAYMFASCPDLVSVDLTGLDTTNAHNMSYMFNLNKKLQNLDCSTFNTANATNMSNMFNACNALYVLNISSFDTTSVTNMSSMFANLSSLHTITFGSNFQFKGTANTTSSKAVLPTPQTSRGYTGKWVKSDGSAGPLTPAELRDQFDANASSWAGTWIAEKWWEITSSGELIIGNGSNLTLPISPASSSGWPWFSRHDEITSARFIGTVMPNTSCAYMFCDLNNMQSVDLTGFNTLSAKNMNSMFRGCTSLRTITLDQNFAFTGSANTNATKAIFPSPFGIGYTGKWINQEKSIGPLTSEQIRDQYDANAATYSGTWTAEALSEGSYTVVYNSGDGTFSNNRTTNTVSYDTALGEPSARYSHTANISDSGVQNGTYANNLQTIETITLPGANSIDILVSYGTENNWDMLYIFEGVYTGSVSRNMDAGQFAKLTGGNNTLSVASYTIPGDTVTFAFYSDNATGYYGYYAIVTDSGVHSEITSGTYEEPTPNNPEHGFKGWNTAADGSGDAVDPDRIKKSGNAYAMFGYTASGDWWRITGSGELIIGTGNEFTIPIAPTSASEWGWNAYASQIQSVSFDGTVHASSSCQDMFNGLSNLADIDFTGFDTSSTTVMWNMFKDCSSITSLNLSDFNTSNVTNMCSMFDGCDALKHVTLGDDFRFTGAANTNATKAILPTPSGDPYTGSWVKEDGSVGPLTSAQIRDQYDANATSYAGTWRAEYVSYDLTITSTISGNEAAKDKYFKFDITIDSSISNIDLDIDWTGAPAALSPVKSDATSYAQATMLSANTADDSDTLSGYQWEISSSPATKSIYLTNGQSVVICGIPSGSTYSVSETMEGYKSSVTNGTISNSSGMISNATAAFTATRNGVVPAGVVLKNAGGIIIASVGIIGVGLMLALKMRKRKDD